MDYVKYLGYELYNRLCKRNQPSSRQIVMIESPYSGDIDRNIRYLQLCMAESGIIYNELPYASHAYMTQHPRCKKFFVSDYDEKWNVFTRETAIEASQLMRQRCDKTVFYTDLGWSRGMKSALGYCQANNLPYEERKISNKLSEHVPFLTDEFRFAIVMGKTYEKFLD